MEYLSFLKDWEIIEVTLILCNCLANVRKQRSTQVTEIRCRWCWKTKHSFCRLHNCIQIYIIYPRICVDFLHSTTNCKELFHISYKILIFLIDCTVKCCCKWCWLEIVVSIHSGNFFHYIIFNGNVTCGTPCRSDNVHVLTIDLYIKSKFLKLALDLIICQMLSKSLLKPYKVYINLSSLEFLYIFITVTCHFHFRIQLFEILHGKCKCLVASLRIDSFFISWRSFCTVIITKCSSSDSCCFKVCDLKNDTLCLRQDRILCSTHNTSQCNRFLGICNYKVICTKRKLFVIQKK